MRSQTEKNRKNFRSPWLFKWSWSNDYSPDELLQNLFALFLSPERRAERYIAKGDRFSAEKRHALAVDKFLAAYRLYHRIRNDAVMPMLLAVAEKITAEYRELGDREMVQFWLDRELEYRLDLNITQAR